eukprot:364063-Chlamydomonas_euryale.AAC.2
MDSGRGTSTGSARVGSKGGRERHCMQGLLLPSRPLSHKSANAPMRWSHAWQVVGGPRPLHFHTCCASTPAAFPHLLCPHTCACTPALHTWSWKPRACCFLRIEYHLSMSAVPPSVARRKFRVSGLECQVESVRFRVSGLGVGCEVAWGVMGDGGEDESVRLDAWDEI